MNIKIRIAKKSDLEMINEIYRSIDFKESVFENEKIIISEIDNIVVGIGRLQKINSNSLELGGIYVKEDCRGKGIADKMVSKLLTLSSDYEYVYCIPFQHLEKFYKSFDFEEVNKNEIVPQKVINKYTWCNEFYTKKALLLVKKHKFLD